MRPEGNRNPSYSYSTFDRLAERYDSWFEEAGRLIFSTEVRAFRTVLPMLPEPWLEIGVGSGRFARALGIDVGIDPSRQLLEMAKQRGIDVVLARGEDPVFKNETFGTVFLIVTICFLDNPVKVLREIHRILTPEGRVVLGLVLWDSPWGSYYREKKAEGHPFYDYATFFSMDEMSKLLEETDFMIEKTVSTLFQEPEKVKHIEKARKGYSTNAGFTILLARKTGC
jgi:SAM-dependent methyltransferase